ncbi:hypothetical protein D3C86_1508400 [compost metagenome]
MRTKQIGGDFLKPFDKPLTAHEVLRMGAAITATANNSAQHQLGERVAVIEAVDLTLVQIQLQVLGVLRGGNLLHWTKPALPRHVSSAHQLFGGAFQPFLLLVRLAHRRR